MRRPVDVLLPLSVEDAHLVASALSRYVDQWKRHFDEDAGRTHGADEWEQVRVEAGRLIWRVEELAVLPGQTFRPSEWAVRPPDEDEDEGGAGVREPRRPAPSAPAASEDKGGA